MKYVLPLVLLLGACATKPGPEPEPRIVTVEVPIAVAAACVPKELKASPEYVDTDEALRGAPDAASRYQLLYAGRKQRTARLGELEPIVNACPREK